MKLWEGACRALKDYGKGKLIRKYRKYAQSTLGGAEVSEPSLSFVYTQSN